MEEESRNEKRGMDASLSKHNTTRNSDGFIKVLQDKSRTHSSLDILTRHHVFERDAGIVVFPREVGEEEA